MSEVKDGSLIFGSVAPGLFLQENINAVKNKPVMIHVASLKIFMIIILILLSVKVEINSYGQPSGIKKNFILFF